MRFDDGNGTPMVHAVLNLDHVIVEWNGCNQATRITEQSPVTGKVREDMETGLELRLTPALPRMSTIRYSDITHKTALIFCITIAVTAR